MSTTGRPSVPSSSAGGTTAPSTSSASETGASSAPATSAPASPSDKWTPQGELAHAEPVDRSVGSDQKVTVLWPRGKSADHALTIKLQAKRNGDKLNVTMYAANYSGEQVSLLTGTFGSAVAVDERGQSLDFEDFDNGWTLTNPGDSPYLQQGQPMSGVMIIDAPKTGNMFSIYWTQAVGLGGIIMVRDVPIVG
ncbi:MAG: hypothetical protein ACJ786_39990 [Catenulispora sp.]